MLAIRLALVRYTSAWCSKNWNHLQFSKSGQRGMKLLSVAEKNDAAKSIAGHLSKGTYRKREGFSVYNKIYEFEINVFGKNCTMIMTSVSGHLLTYEFIGAYKNWQSCNPLSLFEAPVVKSCPEDYQNIKKTLEREIRNCQGLIIWTDCDREGENIGFEIIQVCSEVKPSLQIYRAKFSEITATSVNRALQNLETPNKNISDAVDVRQELDLRIGAAFTRFQTLRLQKVFPEKLANNLISYGSCQFPTLGFVVERYRAVENFVPENFWKIVVTHTQNDLKVEFSWKRNRLSNEQACMAIHDVCMENPLATVENVKSKPKSKWRPLPLDTTEMEKLGSRKLRINAKEVMKIAEKLYTQGIISYPRTETNIYPKELNLSNLVQLHIENPEWGFFAKQILDDRGPTPRQGKKSDQAHPPIHPTKHVTNLSGNDKRVYELIVRSFLACCSKDAQGHETIVDIDIANEKFSANGLMILARNYLDVYPYEKWSGKEIHIYEQGQTFSPTSIDLVQGQTSAPNLLTEADLISLMEKHGIGTDATHADHIETIKSRLYVALANNIHFVPGLLGMGLVEGYDDIGLAFSKPDLRAGLETDLKKICDGEKQPQEVLSQQISTYKNVYITVSQEAQKIDQALSKRFNQNPQNAPETEPNVPPIVMKCNKCRSDMVLRSKKENQGFFVSCMSYPQCKNAIWFPSFIDTVRVTGETCAICGPSTYKLEFTWKNRALGLLYTSPHVGCVSGCDFDLLQVLNINRNNSTSLTQTTANSSNIAATNRNNTNTSQTRLFLNTNPSTGPTNPRTVNTQQSNQNDSSGSRGYGNTNNFMPPPSQNSTSNNFNNSLGSSWFNGTNNSGTSRQPPNIPFTNSSSSNDNDVVCNCGQPAVLLTVRKASPNMGRQFYKCQKPKESGGCNFFLWASTDDGETNTNTSNNIQTPWNSSQPSTSNSGWGNQNGGNNYNMSFQSQNNQSSNDIPNCNCNIPSKAITVQKEGANKGRLFYGCSNSVPNRCSFFQWANDASNTDSLPSTSWNSQSTRGRGRGRGRGASQSTRGAARPPGERAKKKCGNCREEGHTRNKCPRLE